MRQESDARYAPLAMTEPAPTPKAAPTATPNGLPRVISPFGAAAVMVGVIIGSGIFQTPPDIARHLGSPWLVLAFWVLGGVLSLCGALTFAELACMYPQSGGTYVFIRECYGRCVAFVFGWSYMLLIKPLAAGAITVVFTSHLASLLRYALPGLLPPEGTPLFWHDSEIITCVTLALLTAINAWGVKLGTRVAEFLTTIKFVAVAALVLLPLAAPGDISRNFASGPAPGSLLQAIAPVLAGVLWTFDGWADVGAIAGEVKDPQKNLPKIYALGTLAVTGLYVAVNAALMMAMPLAQMRSVESVAPFAFGQLLGPAAGAVVAAIVVLSTMGSTHSSIMTGARVTFQQARDGLLFSPLGRISGRQTPAVALWVQLTLSCVAVLFFKYFDALAGGYVFSMLIFYSLAAAALLVFRVTRPDVPRPFRVPGYPLVPLLFIIAALGMTVLTILGDFSPGSKDPWSSVRFLAIMALGVPAYFVWEWAKRGRASASRGP